MGSPWVGSMSITYNILYYNVNSKLVRLRLGDDLVHDFARPAADGIEAGGAVEPLDATAAQIAGAAVDLDRLVAHVADHVARRVLGHRRVRRRPLAAEV